MNAGNVAFDPDREITPHEVAAARSGGEAMLLLDCRRAEENALCSLGDDLLIPMDELGERLEELEPWREKAIVVYCRSGQRSLMVTDALRRAGFGNVKSLAGGINRWSVEIDPTIPQY